MIEIVDMFSFGIRMYDYVIQRTRGIAAIELRIVKYAKHAGKNQVHLSRQRASAYTDAIPCGIRTLSYLYPHLLLGLANTRSYSRGSMQSSIRGMGYEPRMSWRLAFDSLHKSVVYRPSPALLQGLPISKWAVL